MSTIYLLLYLSVISAVVYGAMAVGEANSFTPNYAKAKMSASHVLMLINRVPAIDNASENGDKPVSLSYMHMNNRIYSMPNRR